MPQPGNGGLQITLKDVYTSQQSIERALADSFAELKITLTKIQSHLDTVDQRNMAADELHREQGRRLGDIERVLDISGVRTLREDRDRVVAQIDDRIRRLEASATSAVAVESAESKAEAARRQARVAFFGMIAALAAVAGVIIAFATLMHRH